MKKDGRLVVKKYRIAGIGGGCMLSPTDIMNGTFPYKMYIRGGFLINFLICVNCFCIF